MASVSPTRIVSNRRIAPATPTTSRQAASSASPAPAGTIPTPSLHQPTSSHGETQSASVLHGHIADFNGQTSFLTTDGRVKNPVPSKLQGMADNKNGNFAVMHIDLGRSEKSMRNDAAKRTSEGTEAAARIANQAGYQSVKRSKLAWPPQDGDPSNPSQPLGLGPHEAKAEQARLLTLLRSVNPIAVADQLCKAVAFFGGIPGAPAPETRMQFPQSHQSNGSGSQFVSWLAEIFPASADHSSLPAAPPAPNANAAQNQTPPVSTQPTPATYNVTQPDAISNTQQADAAADPTADPNAPAVPVKRGRGRPKGSKGKPKNKDQPPADGDPMALHGSQGPNAPGTWPGQQMYSTQQGTPGQADTGTPGKKRGRPKGSKNKPKNPDPATADADATQGQEGDESQNSFMSPLGQIPNSLSLGQDGNRSSSGPLGLSNMIEPSTSQTQSGWTSIGIPANQDASPAPSRKRKNEKQQSDASASTPNMPPGIQQDGAHAADPNGKRRRFSKDGAVFPQMGGQARMNSSESPVQNSSFQSPSQQMMSSGSFDSAQQPPNRKPGARSQPTGRPGQPQPQQYHQQQVQQQPQQQPFPHQSGQSQQQAFGQQPGQHKSPVIGGNPPQQSAGAMDMSGTGLSRSAMYNQQQQQQLQHFMNQQRMSVDMNPGANPSSQFNQGNSGGKSPMFPQGHMVRAASGDASMQHQQRPSPASQSSQLTQDASRMGQPNFGGRAPPVTTAAASPSINSPFPPNYAARNYMSMGYGSMGGGRVPDTTTHSFGGSAGQMSSMNHADQANMGHRMYQSMQQHQQQQRQ